MVEVRTGSTGSLDAVAPHELAAKPMRADAQRNHERILQAAEEIFALDGVMVPIDIVAERAGVGIGTLYRHFPTKESLYEAIVLTRLNELLRVADDAIDDAEAEPGAALDAFLREFARQASEKQDLFEALGQAGVDIKSRFAERVDELMSRIDTLRQRAVESGAIRSDVETSDILNLIMGTCHAAGHSRADEQGLQRLVSIVIAGIQPTSPM
ncbi:MAG TPA: TetR/AcrR family transcriptional regulator [Acidimicrobiales bacterium]|jgi:AcrR family transcriptional regulator|nr:TetR/AcrR family transcriptional regulator [Acidimicrobiales bacterium]